MKKIIISSALIGVVLFSSSIFSKKANADVIIPGQTQNQTTNQTYSVTSFISLSKHIGSPYKVTGYVIKKEQIPWSCSAQAGYECSPPEFTDNLTIADSASDTDGLLVKYGGYDSNGFIVGRSYTFTISEISAISSDTRLVSFTENITIPNTASSSPSQNQIPRFTRSLRLGVSGQDVKNLQIFLNSQKFTVSASGAGSSGNETSYFGPATYKALIKFQNYYASSILAPVGLTLGTGYFGPSTISKVNQIIGNQ